MSRIGKRIIEIPAGVTVEESNGVVTVKGPKGELTLNLVKGISIKVEGTNLEVLRDSDVKEVRAMHGTTNANITNMIAGVSKGFEKSLEIVGVGYRFAMKGNTLVINAGYSHQVEIEVPAELTCNVTSNTELTISGIDKVKVGEFAANVRKVRQPEPYKGKGIRYKDEFIRRKEGKKAA